ncbi:MAG: FISUMP domain-containing protein [Bacteroidales bacterium]|jgi:uncharacterized protein (TIGR02145 family)|nr:FISUMP domain-containing protein [Bacteroidales bacterium]
MKTRILLFLFFVLLVNSCKKENETLLIQGNFTDTRDGRIYQTIKIDKQCWMAENLAYLPSVSPSSQGSETVPYYYVYDYQGTDVVSAKQHPNYSTFGALYNWSAALQACPSGWHLPTDAEWTQLENYLADNGYNYDGSEGGGRDKIAKSLASAIHWNTSTSTGDVGNDLSQNNSSGFSALPGGNRYYEWGSFNYLGNFGYWWSSTELSVTNTFYRSLNYNHSNVVFSNGRKDYGLSIRCVQN